MQVEEPTHFREKPRSEKGEKGTKTRMSALSAPVTASAARTTAPGPAVGAATWPAGTSAAEPTREEPRHPLVRAGEIV